MDIHNVSNYLKEGYPPKGLFFPCSFGYPYFLLFCTPGKESINIIANGNRPFKSNVKNYAPSPYKSDIFYSK